MVPCSAMSPAHQNQAMLVFPVPCVHLIVVVEPGLPLVQSSAVVHCACCRQGPVLLRSQFGAPVGL